MEHTMSTHQQFIDQLNDAIGLTPLVEPDPTPPHGTERPLQQATTHRAAIYMTGTDYDDAWCNLFGDTGSDIQGTSDLNQAQEWADNEEGHKVYRFILDVHYVTEEQEATS
jgi:hypothetical protein